MHTEVARNLAFDVVEKAAELDRTMPAVKFSNHFATGDIESGEERSGAVSAVIMAVVLRGGMGAGERKAVAASLKSIPDDAPRILLATGRYIGEGFDDARLDTLFLALPVSWRGMIQQYAGRPHRLHHRKRDVTIFDYVDALVPVLAKMHQKRLRGYAAIGYSVAPR